MFDMAKLTSSNHIHSHKIRSKDIATYLLADSAISVAGAGEVIRTPDLLITNQLLYQLSYPGTGGNNSAKE